MKSSVSTSASPKCRCASSASFPAAHTIPVPPGSLLGKPVFLRLIGEGLEGTPRSARSARDTSWPIHPRASSAAIREVYAPLLIGRSVSDTEAIDELLTSRLAGNPAARALIDIALHDAMGKALGVPVHQLIGGRSQSEIELEWSVSLADDVGVMIEEARQAVDDYGIKVLCLKAAGKGGWRHDVDEFWQGTRRRWATTW